jgi:Skp family chaperone for outer membrane proteins
MMRWSVFAAVAVAAVGAAFVTGAAVPTKTAKPPFDVKADGKPDEARQLVVVGQKTGYFNMARVMREYKRAKTAVARLNVRKDRMVANLLGMRNMHAELEAALKVTTNEKRKEEIAAGLITIRRQVEDADREVHKILNNRASIILVELHDELRAMVGAVARDNGLVAVLAYPDAVTPEEADNPMIKELRLKPPAAHPFYLDPSVDFTDEILRRLNEKFDAQND